MKYKSKKCSVCKKSFSPFRSLQKACSLDCAVKLAKKTATKKAKEDKRKTRERLLTPKQRINKVRVVFQKFIRLRDALLPCISCGTTKSAIFHAGHYLKAELFPGLIFNESNCHKQCVKCNYFKDGNELEYRKGLIQRYGEDLVINLESTKDLMRIKRYTPEELEAIKQKYLKKIKHIEKFGNLCNLS